MSFHQINYQLCLEHLLPKISGAQELLIQRPRCLFVECIKIQYAQVLILEVSILREVGDHLLFQKRLEHIHNLIAGLLTVCLRIPRIEPVCW